MADKLYADWSEERKIRKREYNRKWYTANIERERERHRKNAVRRRAANPESANKAQAKWRAANPERVAGYARLMAAKRLTDRTWAREVDFKGTLKKRYGLSVVEYNSMLVAQNGCCAVCGTFMPGGRGRWHVDHCSKTGEIRALLCSTCNPGLGFFKHDIDLLQRAIDYLRKFSLSP
jgi:hypothetical protein